MGEHSNKRDIFFNLDVDEKHTIWLALGSLDKLPEGENSSNKIPSNIAMCTVRVQKERERRKL